VLHFFFAASFASALCCACIGAYLMWQPAYYCTANALPEATSAQPSIGDREPSISTEPLPVTAYCLEAPDDSRTTAGDADADALESLFPLGAASSVAAPTASTRSCLNKPLHYVRSRWQDVYGHILVRCVQLAVKVG
jgi:hypothetical protein